MLAGKQNKLAGECFIVVLTAIIDEFGIAKADAKKKNKMKLAKMYPFIDNPGRAGHGGTGTTELTIIGRLHA